MSARENRRQLVHLGVLLLALPVPFLGPRWSLALTAGAVIHNWVVMPLTGLDKAFLRENERFLNGVKIYPLAVMLLVALLPLPLAMGAWAHLAVGDGFSNILGRRYGRTNKLPWNRDKSFAGTIGFAVTAAPAGVLMMAYTQHFGGAQAFLPFWSEQLGAGFSLGAMVMLSTFGALVGAVMESLAIRVDDNLSVSLGSGAAMAAFAATFLG